MGPMESATRNRLRRVVQPTNPASARLADAAVRLARLLDAGDNRPMARQTLALALSHLRDCGPGRDSFLDDLRARHCVRQADQFELTADQFRGDPPGGVAEGSGDR